MLFIFKYVFRVFTGRAKSPKPHARSTYRIDGHFNDERSAKSRPSIDNDVHVGKAYKIKAKTDAEVRARMSDLPKVQVVHVKDGDTAVVMIGRDENVVRLDSIDCPEDGQSWGDTAAFGLIKLIGGKTVLLEQHGQDHHGRTLATIYAYQIDKQEWINVNERMVMLGHAWVSRKYSDHLPPDRQAKLKRIERWAQSKRVGLWHEPNPVPPWNWRYEDRNS